MVKLKKELEKNNIKTSLFHVAVHFVFLIE